MTVWCLGSINIDMFYEVPHIVRPGETLAAISTFQGLGGKGANQSVAAARAGVRTRHIGAIGAGSDWVIERLQAYGVDTYHIARTDEPTGHAIINVAADGENAIVILPGANTAQSTDRLEAALSEADAGDVLMLQNETNLQVEAAAVARERGLRVVYSAAPFDAEATGRVLPYIDVLLLNEIEADQLQLAVGTSLEGLPVPEIIVTLGARGARLIDNQGGRCEVNGLKVKAVDTTGAGDTFAGYFAAGLSQGQQTRQAMSLAVRAAALKVTRKGTADAIPSLAEVEEFEP